MATAPWLADLAQLADPSGRSSAADRLARRLGAEALIIFLRDSEVGELLPAPGFAQTLRGKTRWDVFLDACTEHRIHAAPVPWGESDSATGAAGIAESADLVLVLIGGAPVMDILEDVRAVLPLLRATLQSEHDAAHAAARAGMERDAAKQAAALIAALDLANRDLERAYRANRELNSQLRRLVVETHHRVKNHLQVLGAMVDLQLMNDDEHIPAEEFRRIKGYIRTLSDLHDLLTETSKAGQMQATAAVRPVLEQLFPKLQEAINRDVRFEIDDVVLPVKRITSLAMLASELIGNAVKHGDGGVAVQLNVVGQEAVLLIDDSGPGFPPDFDAEVAANTGLGLVHSFVRIDLQGRIRFENRPEGGGRVVVTFPVPSDLEHSTAP